MADKSIQFSVPMVRALIEGTKSQTRRLTQQYQIGDRLYVREPWRVARRYDGYSPVSSRHGGPILTPQTMSVLYIAGGQAANMEGAGWTFDYFNPRHMPEWAGKYRQAMHMPRWASRLTLRVSDVRIERLHDISEDDCLAEGLQVLTEGDADGDGRPVTFTYYRGGDDLPWTQDPGEAYFALLDMLHGEGFADSNPQLVAYSFSIERGNIDMLSEAA